MLVGPIVVDDKHDCVKHHMRTCRRGTTRARRGNDVGRGRDFLRGRFAVSPFATLVVCMSERVGQP